MVLDKKEDDTDVGGEEEYACNPQWKKGISASHFELVCPE